MEGGGGGDFLHSDGGGGKRLCVPSDGGDVVDAEGSWIRSLQGTKEELKGAITWSGIHGGNDGARPWSSGYRDGARALSGNHGGVRPMSGGGGGGASSGGGSGTRPCIGFGGVRPWSGGVSSWGGGAGDMTPFGGWEGSGCRDMRSWSGDDWPNSFGTVGSPSSWSSSLSPISNTIGVGPSSWTSGSSSGWHSSWSSSSSTSGGRFRAGHHRRHRSGCRCQQRRVPGRERRRGSWWDVRSERLAVEGVDFAQDMQEGGGDEYMFIPDSDDEGFQGIICTDDGEFVPETEPLDVATMDKNEGEINNQRAHSPKVDPPSVMGMANQDTVKSKETMPMNLAVQEPEYKVMGDFELEMVRLVLPGYIPWSREKFYAMAKCSSTEQRKLEEGKESEDEMSMNLAASSQEQEMSLDLAAYSQEEEYEPLDESQLELVQQSLDQGYGDHGGPLFQPVWHPLQQRNKEKFRSPWKPSLSSCPSTCNPSSRTKN